MKQLFFYPKKQQPSRNGNYGLSSVRPKYSILLKPGYNECSEEAYDFFKPQLEAMCKQGCLTLEEHGPPQHEPEPPKEPKEPEKVKIRALPDVTVTELEKILLTVDDPEVLKHWLDEEKRVTGRIAIQERLDDIAADKATEKEVSQDGSDGGELQG